MRRPRTIPIGHVFGVRVGAAPSWFLFLGLTVVFLSESFSRWIPTASQNTTFVLAALAALAFSASIALHELGHALVAKRQGIEVLGIDLWVLGGFTHMGRETHSPGEEFKVAAAGPAVNAVLLAVAIAVMTQIVPPSMTVAQAFGGYETTSGAVVICSWIGLVNGGILAFNLLPGYPLDGGRIAQAIIWKVTGRRGTATRLTGRAGSLLGMLTMAFGFLLLWRNQEPIAGLSLVVLGWFLAQGARGAQLAGSFSERLHGVTAADVMEEQAPSVLAATTASEAADLFSAPSGTRHALPVVDDAGRLLGVLRSEQLDRTLADGRPLLTAAEIVGPGGEGDGVRGDSPIEQLLRSQRLAIDGILAVVDENGLLRGTVTVERVQELLRRRA